MHFNWEKFSQVFLDGATLLSLFALYGLVYPLEKASVIFAINPVLQKRFAKSLNLQN